VGLARLPIDGDHHRTVTFEIERHHSGKRAVHEPQPDALPCPDGFRVGSMAVQRDKVADATGHSGFHRVAEAAGDLPLPCEPPVRQEPKHLAIDRDGLALLDNQCPGEAAAELLQTVGVRVIPERACV
jgi:hypothetical protein